MASATAVSHRALDGAAYRLESDLDLREPATSALEVIVGGRLVEFTAGDASLGDSVAASLGVEGFDSELSFAGGILQTAVTEEREPRSGLVERPLLVVWRGRRYAMVTRLYDIGTTEVLGLLRTLRVQETANGLTLTPDRTAGSANAAAATVIKEIPGLGLLELTRRTKAHAAQLPPWKGVATAAGDLYRDTFTDGTPFFVLSGPEVWATVAPLPSTTVEKVPDLVGRLTLALA
ncbi:hypothetical protein SRB5_45820 [Streptomyces sp. RB5]|uniref:Uncharacterized protein n=1 Tax=Streptomyces smaragdinus TaxID=2585196 RepID=A0A7K0CLQ3_9ACTN|nr:hypothetical protein [Streptomyces smaragdinus]MQY14415.1 hypothetical protein [Streptomyces smaragdinus]